MTFKQWINDFDTVSDDIRHVVLRPDFPEEDRYLDMLSCIEQTSVNSKVFFESFEFVFDWCCDKIEMISSQCDHLDSPVAAEDSFFMPR